MISHMGNKDVFSMKVYPFMEKIRDVKLETLTLQLLIKQFLPLDKQFLIN